MKNSQDKLRIGFMGFGEAASGITSGLLTEGLKEIKAYDKKQDKPSGEGVRKRAKSLGVDLVSFREVAEHSEVVISAVVCANALEAAEWIAPYLGARHLYVDINATSPMTKKQVAEVVEKFGCKFVDAAVMNPVPSYKHKVPMMVSGSGAEAFCSLFKPYGMNLTLIQGEAGHASSVKMLRSIFMKGMAALFMEMLTAAYSLHTHELVLATIRETLQKMTPDQLVHRLVTGTAIDAGRRVHEMEEVIETLKVIGVQPVMATATRDVLSWVESLDLNSVYHGEMAKSYLDVLQEIAKRKAVKKT